MSNPLAPIFGAAAEAGNIYQDIGSINKTQAGINQDTSTANQAYGNQNTSLQGVEGLISQITGPGGITSQLTGPGGITSQLTNWNGLKPAELAQLQTSLGNSTQSLLSSLQSQMGGVANPAMALQRLGANQAQSNLQLTSNLGAQAQSQELGALESAGSLTTSAGNLTAQAGGLGLGVGQQYGQQGSQFMNFASQLSQLLSGEQQNLSSATTGLATDIGNIGNPFAKPATTTPAASTPTMPQGASTAGSGLNDIASQLTASGILFAG